MNYGITISNIIEDETSSVEHIGSVKLWLGQNFFYLYIGNDEHRDFSTSY